MSNDVTRHSRIGASPVSTGRWTYGTTNVSVFEWGEGAALRIGAFCSLAKNVTILLGGNHRTDWITTFPFGSAFPREISDTPVPGHPATGGDVIIGSDVWIGQGVTILSGVTIGDGAVLATNSTVVRNVAPYEIVGGNPAKSIRKRFDDEIIALLLELRWWELPIDDIRQLIPQLCTAPTAEHLVGLIARYRA